MPTPEDIAIAEAEGMPIQAGAATTEAAVAIQPGAAMAMEVGRHTAGTLTAEDKLMPGAAMPEDNTTTAIAGTMADAAIIAADAAATTVTALDITARHTHMGTLTIPITVIRAVITTTGAAGFPIPAVLCLTATNLDRKL